MKGETEVTRSRSPHAFTGDERPRPYDRIFPQPATVADAARLGPISVATPRALKWHTEFERTFRNLDLALWHAVGSRCGYGRPARVALVATPIEI